MENSKSLTESHAFSRHQAINNSWIIFQENFLFLVNLMLMITLTALVFLWVSDSLVQYSIFASNFVDVLFVVVATIFEMGVIYIALELVRGRSVEYADILTPHHLLLPFIVAELLFGLAVIFGFILLIIPGLIVISAWWFYGFVLVDEGAKEGIGAGAIHALDRSLELTEGARWDVFIFWIELLLLNLIGFMFFFVGLAVTMSITVVAMAHVYTQLKDRSIALESSTNISEDEARSRIM